MSILLLAVIYIAWLLKKFGTYTITVFSTALTAVALLAFSYSGNYVSLCLCAIPLGLGAGCIDTALNNYVAIHYSSKHMNFLHCFYGIGITVSPYILSLVMTGEQGWRSGYRITFFIRTTLAFIVLFSLPLWQKAADKNEADQEEQIIFLGQTVLGAALVILMLPGNKYVSAIGLFLIGLGNGPLFPNVNYLTPENILLLFYIIMVTAAIYAKRILVRQP